MPKVHALVSSLVMVVLLAAGSMTVRAIVYGFVDTGNAFSNVGAFVVRAPGGQISPICSGTLIAQDVFLTASHCTVFYEQELVPRGYTAFVSFDNPIPFGSLTTASTDLIPVVQVVSNPRYSQAQSDSGDIAVLLVSAADTAGIEPATLPTADLLEQLSARNGLKTASFTVSGYGVQNRVVGGGTPFFTDVNPVPRMYAFESFGALNKGYLRLSQNPATGNGGACFGDSGGPNFLSTASGPILVAITITGDAVCRATNVVYRVDTASAREFLGPYVDLP
jgi:hypothetical protein